MARTSSIEQRTYTTKKIGKSWSQPIRAFCPTGHMAPIGSSWEATAPWREQNPAHSGPPVQQDVWHLVAVSSSQEQDHCATKDIHATVVSLPEWDEVSSELTCEWKSKVHLQAHSWEWVDLRVKVKGALASTFLRGDWLASERAALLLVYTSKATQEQALQVLAWNIQKQQQRWRWRQVLERCCRGRSRGETDDSGPFHAPYIPQEVGRVTIWLLPWVVVNRVKCLWESCRVLGHRKVLSYTMLLLVRCAEVIWLIR